VTPAGIITLNDDTSRDAQLTELRAVNYGGAQTLTAPQQTQARANINAETAGAAATVAGNLTTHEGLTTTAHGGIVASTDPRLTDARTPTAHASTHATAGSDPITPAAIGAEVAGTTATHAGLTGTAVHGLGTISTQAANNVSITGGSVTGITDLAIADGGTGASTVDGARANLGLDMITMPARQLDHSTLLYDEVNVLGGATWDIGFGMYRVGVTSVTPNSRSQSRPSTDYASLNHSSTFASWNRRLEVGGYFVIFAPNAEGVFRMMYGKGSGEGYGALASGNYVGWQLSNSTITELYACKAGVLTTIAVSVELLVYSGAHIWAISEGNGTVTFYVNGTTIGATSNGPTASVAFGSITAEINNGATAADYSVLFTSMSKGY
jgi:hypothetical protein